MLHKLLASARSLRVTRHGLRLRAIVDIGQHEVATFRPIGRRIKCTYKVVAVEANVSMRSLTRLIILVQHGRLVLLVVLIRSHDRALL